MEELSTYEIMALYLLAFQVSEGGPDNFNQHDQIELSLNQIFLDHGLASIEGIIFDEDGAPVGSGREGVYNEYNEWFNKTESFYQLIPLEALQKDNIEITPEYLISLIPDKSY